MALHELTMMKRISRGSFKNKKIRTIDLALFAMQLNGDEEPLRMYDASTTGIDGMLLVTNKQLMFIGNDDGQTVGIKSSINNARILSHKDKGEFADIMIDMDGKLLTFTMMRFDVNRIKSQIG